MDSSVKCIPLSDEMDQYSDDSNQSIEISSAVSVSLCSEHEDGENRKDLVDSVKFKQTNTCAWVASMANYQNAFDFNDVRSFTTVKFFSDYKNDHTSDQFDNNMDEENGSMDADDTKNDDLDSTNKDSLDQNMLEYSDDSIIFTDDPNVLTLNDEDCEFDFAEVMTEDSINSGYSIISSRGSLKNLSDEDFLNEEYDLNASFDEISKIERKEKVLAFESLFFEPTYVDEKLKKLNDAWNFDMEDSSSPRQPMKVSFDLDLTTVYSYEKPCEDDYDSWILDQMRFKRRIDEFEYMMNPFLTSEHRSNVLMLRNLSLGGI